MAQTTVSSKFQIVIPKQIRTDTGIKTGEVLQVVATNGVISLIPTRPISELRGFLKGMKTTNLRDKRDRA
jgi:AbrB family looped-hinge helix DNA binding protein